MKTRSSQSPVRKRDDTPGPSGRGSAVPSPPEEPSARAPGSRGPLPGEGGAPVRADTVRIGVWISRDARALLDAHAPARALGEWISAAITEKAARDAKKPRPE